MNIYSYLYYLSSPSETLNVHLTTFLLIYYYFKSRKFFVKHSYLSSKGGGYLSVTRARGQYVVK